MFFEVTETAQDKIKKNVKRLQELLKLNSELDVKEKHLFEDLNLTPKQLTKFLNDKETFCRSYDEESWEQLQTEKEKIDRKLVTDLQNIRNPQKTKKALESLNVPRHGIFVR